MSGASGSFSKNLSNSPLKFSTLHPFRSLMFLGRELNNFTDCTKKLSSLIVFSRVDAVLLKRGSLKDRPFLPPFLLLRSMHFGTRFSSIFQRYIIRYLSLLLSSEYNLSFFNCSGYVRCSIPLIILMNFKLYYFLFLGWIPFGIHIPLLVMLV